MKRLLLGLGAASVLGLCFWLARREQPPAVNLEPWAEPWGDC